MTRARMLALVRLLSGETDSSNSYWTDAEINSMLNDVQLLVAEDLPVNLTWTTFSTVASTNRYSLPADFLQLKSVEIETSSTQIKQLRPLGLDQFSDLSDGNFTMEGEPAWFKMEFGAVTTENATQLPGDIWLYPVPDAVYTTRVRYFQMPTDMDEDADVSELPLSVHMAVCYYSAMLIAMKDGNQKKISNLNTLYETKMAKSRKMLHRVNRTGPKTARDEAGYSNDGLVSRRIRRGPLT